MIEGYTEFELDLTKALLEHLPAELDSLEAVPLTKSNVEALPPQAQGVYMLLENGKPTYIGKTDGQHGFSDRLKRHFLSLSARKNLDLERITFKSVRIMVFTVVNVETMLIKKYIGENPLSWQNSGFGSNDPGHRRETQLPSDFDKRHPINIDVPHNLVAAGNINALELLVRLKEELPFDFRYQTDPRKKYRAGHADHRETQLTIPRGNMSLRQLLQEVIVRQLPVGWMASIFPGRVILYKESTEYAAAIEQIRP